METVHEPLDEDDEDDEEEVRGVEVGRGVGSASRVAPPPPLPPDRGLSPVRGRPLGAAPVDGAGAAVDGVLVPASVGRSCGFTGAVAVLDGTVSERSGFDGVPPDAEPSGEPPAQPPRTSATTAVTVMSRSLLIASSRARRYQPSRGRG